MIVPNIADGETDAPNQAPKLRLLGAEPLADAGVALASEVSLAEACAQAIPGSADSVQIQSAARIDDQSCVD